MNNTVIAKATLLIDASLSKVWDALIKPQLVTQFGAGIISDWQVGSLIRYTGVREGRRYEDKGKVLQVQAEETLVSTFWDSIDGGPDIPENYITVRYDLSADGKGTRLTMTFSKRNDAQKEVSNSDQNMEMKRTFFQTKHLLKTESHF
jgi:uncharacterized protein YndB with AHSA1/START domain